MEKKIWPKAKDNLSWINSKDDWLPKKAFKKICYYITNFLITVVGTISYMKLL